MILFKDIYDKAINLFDDPNIQRDYFFNEVKFQKKMYKYLMNGVNLFTNPTNISFLLTDITPPKSVMETFDGDGNKSVLLQSDPLEHSVFYVTVAGKIQQCVKYDKDTKTISFEDTAPKGSKITVEWSYCGQFNTDFKSAATSRISADVIAERVKEIMSRALVLAWAENEKNFLLDIKNVLTDTDFKLYSPANSVRAKVEWVKQLRFDFDAMQTKLCWDVWSRKYTGGKYYG